MLGSITYIFACCIVGMIWSYMNWGKVKEVNLDEKGLDEKAVEQLRLIKSIGDKIAEGGNYLFIYFMISLTSQNIRITQIKEN